MKADEVEYIEINGDHNEHQIELYALSTCGFCKRGIQFLTENSISFKYVYIDKLDRGFKTELKQELKDKYKRRPIFPYLVVDREKVLTGFTESAWKGAIGL